MAALQPVNPKPFLTELTGGDVIVKLKWGMGVHGEPPLGDTRNPATAPNGAQHDGKIWHEKVG